MIRGKGVLAGVIFAGMLVAVVYSLLIPKPSGGPTKIQAEFADAGLLTTGDDVVEYGAKVGTVASMRLSDRGTALVTFSLFSGVTRPRADATVSVRPQNLLGGEYLSLSPGHAARPLDGIVPASRTFVATQLNDLFNSFDRPTATALSLLLNELGRALDARGEDLNQAVLELAPTFDAADRIASQLGQQNAHLVDLISHAEALTAQVAPRTGDLDRLIVSLQRTLTTTALRANGLDRGLAELPKALGQTRRTLALLSSTATAARPLATRLGAAAPEIATAANRLTPFAADARPAIEQLRPLVRETATTLEAGRQSLPRLSSSLHVVANVAPQLRALAKVLDPLAQIAIEGIFAGLGGVAGEPGTQPGDNEPGRNWFRGVGVLGCESFGVAIAPGCLTTVLKTLNVPPIGGLASDSTARHGPTSPTSHRITPLPAPRGTPVGGGPSPRPALPSSLSQLTGGHTGMLGKLLGNTGTEPGGGQPGAPSGSSLQPLLKYLLGR
jgi:phospholipid/cholesterol/gamma-HCH transport system substrate-binding protein